MAFGSLLWISDARVPLETYTRVVRPEPSPADLLPVIDRRCLRGLPVLVHEVSRRAWGLRLRRTEQELALALLFMLPSAHVNRVGVRVVLAYCCSSGSTTALGCDVEGLWTEINKDGNGVKRREERGTPPWGWSEFENAETFRLGGIRRTLISANKDSPGSAMLTPCQSCR
jgi:hypothetical protein